MTTWKALPAELEPDVVRFIEEVRAIKDARNLSFAALAEGTSYSKSSWERCLNSGRLPPAAPVRALAQRTGHSSELLIALWELAEQAASGRGRSTEQAPVPDTGPPPPAAAQVPAAADNEDSTSAPVGTDDGAHGKDGTHRTDGTHGTEAPRRRPLLSRLSRNAVLATLGALAAALGLVAVLAGGTGGRSSPDLVETEDSAGRAPLRGVGADCHGSECDGLDSVEQGCGGDAWTAAISRADSAYIEVRYSSVCRAAWARIRWAEPGDRVDVVAEDGRTYTETVPDDPNLAAFTFMIGVPTPGEVRACWQTEDGNQGCTEPGGSVPLPEAPPVGS